MKSELFKDMTAADQQSYITDFTEYKENRIPLLIDITQAWTDAKVKCMEDGINLLKAWNFCLSFCRETLLFKDYERRFKALHRLINQVDEEIKAGRGVKTLDGKTAVLDTTKTTTNKRGHNTTKESKTENKETKAEGEPITQLPLFDSASIFTPGAKASIAQIKWLLSATLQVECDNIQAIRATLAKESEQAKSLGENNVPAEVIQPHSEAACAAQEQLEAIYKNIDTELAALYMKLAGDNDFGGYKAEVENRGGNIEALLNLLKGYYEKMQGDDNVEKVAANMLTAEEKQAKELTEAEEKVMKAKLHKIRTYMLRTDQKLTARRIEKMKESTEEARALGVDVAEYEAIIAKAEEDFKAASMNADAATDNADVSADTVEPKEVNIEIQTEE